MSRQWNCTLEDIAWTGPGEVAYRRSMVEATRDIADELQGIRLQLEDIRRALTRLTPAREEKQPG